MSDNKLVKTIMDAATLTGLAAGIGWIAKRVVSEQQKNGEPMFVGAGALALGFAAFRFL